MGANNFNSNRHAIVYFYDEQTTSPIAIVKRIKDAINNIKTPKGIYLEVSIDEQDHKYFAVNIEVVRKNYSIKFYFGLTYVFGYHELSGFDIEFDDHDIDGSDVNFENENVYVNQAYLIEKPKNIEIFNKTVETIKNFWENKIIPAIQSAATVVCGGGWSQGTLSDPFGELTAFEEWKDMEFYVDEDEEDEEEDLD